MGTAKIEISSEAIAEIAFPVEGDAGVRALLDHIGDARIVTGRALGTQVGDTELLHRAIGVVYRPATERQSHYYFARLAEQYDTIVHLDVTRSVQPLEDAAPAPASLHDAPESYPSGL